MQEDKNSTEKGLDDTSLNDPSTIYVADVANRKSGFYAESEDDRLLRDASLPGIEKLRLFTKMIRRNRLLYNSSIS